MDKPRALVTGANGFIGSYLVEELIRQGWSVVCLTRQGVGPRHKKNITTMQADLSDPQGLDKTLRCAGGLDVYFHLAARMSNLNDDRLSPYVQTNVLGTSILIDHFLASGAHSFIYASGVAIIGKPIDLPITEAHPVRPNSPYFVSKLAGELICEEVRLSTGRSITSLRISSPYGPGMQENTVLPCFVRAALEGREIILYGTGSRTQNFVHISDVIQACLKATQSEGGVFNVGGAVDISMLDLARLVLSCKLGSKSRIVHIGRKDPQENCRWRLDLSKAASGLGYEPTVSIEKGLANYSAFQKKGEMFVPWWIIP